MHLIEIRVTREIFVETMSGLSEHKQEPTKQTELNHYATGTERPVGSLNATIVALLFLQHNELGKHDPIILSSKTRTLDSILLVGPFPAPTPTTTVVTSPSPPNHHLQTVKQPTTIPVQNSRPLQQQQQHKPSNITPLLYPPATAALFKRKLDKNKAWHI
jgi:hypothetical protein